MIKKKKSNNTKWTEEEILTIKILVNKQMKDLGYVDFKLIAKNMNRTFHACEARAYKLNLEYSCNKNGNHNYNTNLNKLLVHADGRPVFYG